MTSEEEAQKNLACRDKGGGCPAGKTCVEELGAFMPRVPQELFIGWGEREGEKSLWYSYPAGAQSVEIRRAGGIHFEGRIGK